MKVFTLPYDKLHNFIGDEDEEDDLDDEEEDFDGEDGDGEELDAYGNPKESTADSAASSSYPDKDLPTGSSVGLGGGSHGSKSSRKKGKRENSEVTVFHFTLDSLFGRSEEDGDSESTSKSSRGKVSFSSLFEQLLVSIFFFFFTVLQTPLLHDPLPDVMVDVLQPFTIRVRMLSGTEY